jgi:hypothetical protein
VPSRRGLEVCELGTPRSRARDTVALVGDSHSAHWRAALRVVARAKRWRVLSLYRSRCPFTLAIPRSAYGRSQCIPWRRQVVRWFRQHPAIHTVFVSEHSAGRVVPRPHEDQHAAKVRGYIRAWKALPASVRRIVVIRDPPYDTDTTFDCVERAMARRIPAGLACARPREVALEPDPAYDGVARLGSPRVRSIDLTAFMCDDRLCYPVIGGVLVRKDRGHLTRLFSETLGPYLLRAVVRDGGSVAR